MNQTLTTSGAPPVRASDAERDQTAEILRAGYAEGRLSRAELDERLTAAYAAKTHADLHDLTVDLPGAVPASATRDRSATAALPILDPESGTGTGPNWCLLPVRGGDLAALERLLAESPGLASARIGRPGKTGTTRPHIPHGRPGFDPPHRAVQRHRGLGCRPRSSISIKTSEMQTVTRR